MSGTIVFRLGLRNYAIKLCDLLPGIRKINIFLTDDNLQNPNAIWRITVLKKDLDRLRNEKEDEIDKLWKLSVFDPLDAQNRLARAWLVPVNLDTNELMHAITVVQVYQGLGKPQSPKEYTADLYFNDRVSIQGKNLEYGDSKILAGCCPTADGDFSVNITGKTWEIKNIIAKKSSVFKRRYPPLQKIRLRLSKDRSGVIVEAEKKAWAKGYVIQLKLEADEYLFSTERAQKKTLDRQTGFEPAFEIPFKSFKKYNGFVFTTLNFDSNLLNLVDRPSQFEGKLKSIDFAASGIEVGVFNRDQLIALKAGEFLEFGPNLKWVKK